MNKLSLFSGIGGDDLASEWAGIETVCFVEKDKYCREVLRKHWPHIPIIEDVKDVTEEKVMDVSESIRWGIRKRKCSKQTKRNVNSSWSAGETKSAVDIISGGFPCQPHSVAGKRKGSLDERNLWPEFRRVIGIFKPRWVVAENVPGIFASEGGLFFNGILCDLAKMGYAVGWCTFGAVDVGALHRRDRVFIVGYTPSNGSKAGFSGQDKGQKGNTGIIINKGNEIPDSNSRRCLKCESKRQSNCRSSLCDWWWSIEPDVGRVAHGVPFRVDRLKGLGNAVVPQAMYIVYKAIVEIENSK